jgi:hypothetical protein
MKNKQSPAASKFPIIHFSQQVFHLVQKDNVTVGELEARRCGGRTQHPLVRIHQSVLDRLKQSSDYRPVNVPNDGERLRSLFQIEN